MVSRHKNCALGDGLVAVLRDEKEFVVLAFDRDIAGVTGRLIQMN
jgi:hypothetical protein